MFELENGSILRLAAVTAVICRWVTVDKVSWFAVVASWEEPLANEQEAADLKKALIEAEGKVGDV